MSETIPISGDAVSTSISLNDFKPAFESEHGSAQLYFQMVDEQFTCMIVADNEADLSNGVSSVNEFLTTNEDNDQSQKRTRGEDFEAGDEVTENISIPATSVGLLIGKSGSSLRVIEIATNTKISVATENENDMRTVTVVGAPDSVAAARDEINRASLPATDSADSALIGPGGIRESEIENFKKGPSNDVVFPAGAIRILIGKHGENVRILQIHYKVYIVIHDNTPDNTSTERKVTVYGTEEAIENVDKEFKIICEAFETGDNSVLEQSKLLKQTLDHNASVEVGPEVIGIIIGRGGETIKALQQRTNTSIQVEQTPTPGNTLRKITITGRTENSVKQALSQINAIILGSSQNNQGGFRHNAFVGRSNFGGQNFRPQGNFHQGGRGGFRQQGNFHQGGRGGFRQQGNYNQGNRQQGGFQPRYNNFPNQGQGMMPYMNQPQHHQQQQQHQQPQHHQQQFNPGFQQQGNFQGNFQGNQQGNFQGNQQGMYNRRAGQYQQNRGSNAGGLDHEHMLRSNPNYASLYSQYYKYYKESGQDDKSAQYAASHYAYDNISKSGSA